jgi:hypothetical protein
MQQLILKIHVFKIRESGKYIFETRKQLIYKV